MQELLFIIPALKYLAMFLEPLMRGNLKGFTRNNNGLTNPPFF
jgi:hypothetical protein